MSVVAVRDGVIAADTFGDYGGVKLPGRKLIRRGDVAIGWSGYRADGLVFADWYFDGADRENLPKFVNREGHSPPIDFHALVLSPKGCEFWCEWFVPEHDDDRVLPFRAIGSGAVAAMAAMHMGAGAVEAVEIACKVDTGCDLPVDHFIIPRAASGVSVAELAQSVG